MDTPADLTQAIAKAVHEAMERMGFTTHALMKATGIPRSTLDRRLTGFSPFTTAELANVAHVLDTSLSALLNEVSAA